MKRSQTTRRAAACLLILLLTVALAGAEPLAVEQLLPPDGVAAVVVRDWGRTRARWRGTALHALLQNPEMEAMLAPWRECLDKLWQRVRSMDDTLADGAGTLFTGETGLAVTVNMAQTGPVARLHGVLRPSDPAAALSWLHAVQDRMATAANGAVAEIPGAGRVCTFTGAGPMGENAHFAVSESGGVLLATLGVQGLEAHKAFLARAARNGGGLSASPAYAAVREKFDDDFDGWVYLGLLPWLRANVPPAQAGLSLVGLDAVEEAMVGIRIEDDYFRTRAYVAVSRTAEEADEGPGLVTDA
jgi:hypothetical protein